MCSESKLWLKFSVPQLNFFISLSFFSYFSVFFRFPLFFKFFFLFFLSVYIKLHAHPSIHQSEANARPKGLALKVSSPGTQTNCGWKILLCMTMQLDWVEALNS